MADCQPNNQPQTQGNNQQPDSNQPDNQSPGGQPGEQPQSDQANGQPQPIQGLTPAQARQLLEAASQGTESLEEYLQQQVVAPQAPPAEDW